MVSGAVVVIRDRKRLSVQTDCFSKADVPAFTKLAAPCDGVEDLDAVGCFPLDWKHLGAFAAVFVAARQLAFAALSNDVPTIAVVVLDLLTKGVFPLLGRHVRRRALEPF